MQISNILKLRVRKTIGGQQKQTSEGKLNSVKIQAFNKRLVKFYDINKVCFRFTRLENF